MTENWEQVPFHTLFRRIPKRTGYGDKELLSVYRDYGVIIKSDRDDNSNRPGESLDDYQLVKLGDLVLNKMKTWQGSLGISAYEGIVSPAYFVYEPQGEFDSRYMHYLLRSQPSIDYYGAHSKGIRVNQWDLQPEYLDKMKVRFPPLEYQQRIADYLDRETAEIDAAVADLDKYMELLEVRRRVVITQAVLGVIGPGVGQSAYWDEVPLHTVASDGGLYVDGDWVESKDQDPNGSIRLTQLADVGDSVFLDKSDRWVNEAKFDELQCTEVNPGDLLIARMPDPIARCTVLPDNLGYSVVTVVDVAILRPSADWDNRFVMWAINSIPFRNDVESRVSGSTRQRISRSALGRTKLSKPSLSTQQEISTYLDNETAEIDSLIADATRLRDLLLKRRSVLVTEVVTGRKQV